MSPWRTYKPKSLTCVCQTYSTYKRAPVPHRSRFFLKTPLSKSLLCVSAAVRSLSQFDRRLRKKKKPCKFPCFLHAADGSQAKQKQLHRLTAMRNENEHAAARTTRIFLHLPHAQVTSCASWTCDI